MLIACGFSGGWCLGWVVGLREGWVRVLLVGKAWRGPLQLESTHGKMLGLGGRPSW